MKAIRFLQLNSTSPNIFQLYTKPEIDIFNATFQQGPEDRLMPKPNRVRSKNSQNSASSFTAKTMQTDLTIIIQQTVHV